MKNEPQNEQLLSNEELFKEAERCSGYCESDCCGARIIFHYICSDCGEHCCNSCFGCDLRYVCPHYKISPFLE